jgi:hypothetical protein
MLASGNDRATSGKAMLTIVASRNARKKPSDAIPRTDRDDGTARARRLRRSIAEPLVGSWLSVPAFALFQLRSARAGSGQGYCVRFATGPGDPARKPSFHCGRGGVRGDLRYSVR